MHDYAYEAPQKDTGTSVCVCGVCSVHCVYLSATFQLMMLTGETLLITLLTWIIHRRSQSFFAL